MVESAKIGRPCESTEKPTTPPAGKPGSFLERVERTPKPRE
jgi:hypothetical protein|tara:strand:+ start:578 stop:700 length:123 start_codon:yes stop_codon:yes gene_type:complete